MDERQPKPETNDIPRKHHEYLDDVFEHEARKRITEPR